MSNTHPSPTPGVAKLGELRKGQGGKILSIGIPSASEEAPDDLPQRLMEMGLLEGFYVEVVHEAPFGGDPIAVRVRGTLLALRRNEANQVLVSIEEVEGE